MFPIDIKSNKPLYEQIIDYVKEQVLRGNLRPQDKLPSVSQLASDLGINHNTVSKAYLELERQQVIETIRGRGTFICEVKIQDRDEEKMKIMREKLKTLCVELQYMGVDKEALHQEIEEIFEQLKRERGEIEDDRDSTYL